MAVSAPSEPRWLSPTEMDAWRSFVETYADLMTAIEADLAPEGLTLGDYQVLVYLSEAAGRAMRMCDLAAMLQLSPSGVTRRLDGLVATGLVARHSSADDRRVMLAVLTPAGFERLEAVAPGHVESVRRRFVDRLDESQLRAVAAAFKAVRSGLGDAHGCQDESQAPVRTAGRTQP